MTGRARHAEVAGKSLPRGPGRGGLGVLPRPELGSEGRSDAVGGGEGASVGRARRGIDRNRRCARAEHVLPRAERPLSRAAGRVATATATFTSPREGQGGPRRPQHRLCLWRGPAFSRGGPAWQCAVQGEQGRVRRPGQPWLSRLHTHVPLSPEAQPLPTQRGARLLSGGLLGRPGPTWSLADLTPRVSNPEGVHAPQRVPDT